MKKRSVFDAVCKIIAVFLLLLCMHFMLRYTGYVLFPRINIIMDNGEKWSQDYGQYYFSRIPRDSLDTVFVGSSHQFCSIDPNLLNSEYGQNCALLTSSSMSMTTSYYAVMEAIELQHPKIIVLECYNTSGTNDNLIEMEKHYFLDDMPNWLLPKWKCVRETGDPPYLYYYPITAMHYRVFDLKWEDFRLPPRLKAGERYCYHYDKTTPNEKWEEISSDRKKPMKEEIEKWLDGIVALCRENEVELILYVAPYFADESSQQTYNGLEDYAAHNNLEYFNLMHKIDEIGLDILTDFLDDDHLNYRGQEKITRYFGRLLLNT